MSGIDWNKQPSWAKHAGVDVACGHPVVWSDECHQYEGRDAILCGPPKVSFYRIASRPDPWTGAGLPPVGTVCELRCKTGGWGIATVTYISPTVCAWLWSAQPEDVECCEEVHKMEFRPIRTPEQIAAEERAEAIEKMWSIYWQPHATSAKQALGLLWDAGLRFPDEKIRDNAMDIDWKRAPRWANVLLDGGCREPSRYSWAAAYETGAKRQYRDGGRIVAKVEHVTQYAVVGYRKAPTE